MSADQSGWFNDHQCATPVEPAGQLRNTNLSAGVIGIAFFSRSRNRANCLRKNRFSAARAKRRRPILAKKLKQSLTIVRRFRTSLESRLKTGEATATDRVRQIREIKDRSGLSCYDRRQLFLPMGRRRPAGQAWRPAAGRLLVPSRRCLLGRLHAGRAGPGSPRPHCR
jgi:hypothetical protein